MRSSPLLAGLAAVALFGASCSQSAPLTRPCAVCDRPGETGDNCAALLRQLGPRFATRTTDHFQVLYCGDDAWAEDTARSAERLHQQFYRTFDQAGFHPQPLTDRLVWVCLDNHDDMAAYSRQADRMDMSWLDGYYSARTNRVAVVRPTGHQADHPVRAAIRPVAARGEQEDLLSAGISGHPAPVLDLTRTLHEGAHQLAFNSGLMKRGVMYPLWASEGLATNFESGSPDAAEPTPENLLRGRRLVAALEHDRLTPLEQLAVQTRIFQGQPEATTDLYAQAWGLFRFLFSQRREQLKQYLAALARLEPGRRSEATLHHEFADAFGPVSQLEKPWAEFLEAMQTLSAAGGDTRQP